MRIKLKRRLCYKGHQLFQTVTWSKLIQALRKLKQIHPQYTDIVIRDDALLCDPTLPDDDSSDEASMGSDDYDEADLMEIDNYEKDALLSEQELKPQGFQTYQSFYNSGFVRLPCSDHSESVKRVVKRNKDKYEKNSEDIESALEEFEQNRDVVIDEWCNLAPESEVVRLQCDENLPERHSDDENEQENVPDYSRQSDAVTEIRAVREQPAVDPAVLPPVRQSKPLCVYDPEQIDLWQEHFQMITLTEIMRQKDDVAFAEMLNRIRVKEKTDQLSQCDRDLLSQAVTAPEECPIEVLHIYATNKNVESHNTDTLKKLHSNIIIINADDFQKDKCTGRMARRDRPFTGGRNDLPDTLNVAEGARVMLTRNLDTLNGLVNGAFGILIKVVRSENDGQIIKLGLRMDNRQPMRHNRSANAASDDLVYIERAEESLKFKGADLDENKIYANPEVTAALQTMRQASVEEMMPLLQVRETASRPDTLTLIHHNTEGLPSHISDIKSHHEMCLADVLCLTESHLQGSFVADSLHLDGYTMFKRNRHVSYTNFPHMASRSGGGVVVYLRNHFQVQVQAPFPALIAVVYRPPDYSLTPFMQNLHIIGQRLHYFC
ncbi:hypothetical protein ACER0C_001855 [Sarotherodon galilaeus]